MQRLEDYAFLGDTHSAGLVSRDGSIDWLCFPRFDSGSCFAAILDADRGGRWKIAPRGAASSSRSYVDETMVLETTFETPEGRVKVIDCLVLEDRSDASVPGGFRPEEVLVRVVRGLAGKVPMSMEFSPRFQYGDVVPWLRKRHEGVEAVGGPDALDLVAPVPLERDDGRVSAEFEVAEGESVDFIAAYHLSHVKRKVHTPGDWPQLVARTEKFWREWAGRGKYQGEWRGLVVRSLVVLKALTYSPSGGIVAAPTTSLPERLGGARNWDYRYCWLRDATFTLEVLLGQGYKGEAEHWRDWLLRAVAGDPEDMQIMYGVQGERRLGEFELPWLSGYEGSRPVRVGNAAHRQFQLDVYGELMDSFHSARRAGIKTSDDDWELEKVIVEFVCDHWQEPDEGIWEVRSERRHFVHSKVMAWVAVDRGIKAAEEFGRDAPLDRWRSVRDEIREQVITRGVNRERGHFKRAYDEEDQVDASLLMLPLVGFVDATHEVMLATIEMIQKELMVDGLLLRYRSDVVHDGLPPGEGAFLMCTFWLVDCLVLLNRTEEARALFTRLAELANDLGLFAEQYDSDAGRLLGNFPQAFSHVALVTSAVALETAGRAREVRRGS